MNNTMPDTLRGKDKLPTNIKLHISVRERNRIYRIFSVQPGSQIKPYLELNPGQPRFDPFLNLNPGDYGP